MIERPLSADISSHLLMNDFNSRTFFSRLRQENERQQVFDTNHRYTSKPASSNTTNRFHRLTSVSFIWQQTGHRDGLQLIAELSQQLLNDDLSVGKRQWQRSQANIQKRMEKIQADLEIRTDLSLKTMTRQCQGLLDKWASKTSRTKSTSRHRR
jgi:hypothetical protein